MRADHRHRLQPLVQRASDRRLTVGAGQDADQGDADLHGRKETGGMFGEAKGDLGAAIPSVGLALQSGPPRGDHREFGHGEDPVQQNEEQNDGEREEYHCP
jgi:hypothetical protein